MKSIVKILALLALVLPLSASTVLASDIMEDPLIGLKFRVGEKRWEEVPPAEAARMGLRDGPWWVFGSYEEEGGRKRYLLLSGMTREALDTDPVTFAAPEPDFGIVMVIENSVIIETCTAISVGEPRCGFSEKALKGVVDNLVTRAVKGYGREPIQELLDTADRHQWMDFFVADGLRRAGFKVPDEIVMRSRSGATTQSDK